jgi:ATP-dependent RNA helicase DDX42
MLFTATFKKKVERLASDVLRDPVRIVVGAVGQANEDIRQQAVILKVGVCWLRCLVFAWYIP